MVAIGMILEILVILVIVIIAWLWYLVLLIPQHLFFICTEKTWHSAKSDDDGNGCVRLSCGDWTTSLHLHYKNMRRWQVMVMDGDDKMIMMKMVMLVMIVMIVIATVSAKKRMGPLSFHSLIWRIPHTHQLRDVSHLKQLRWELMPRTIRRIGQNPSPLLYICFWSMVQLYC